MRVRVRSVSLTNFTPKAVNPVVLVANRPTARLVLLGKPKLRIPPVVWSPKVAPKRVPTLAAGSAIPYQPARLAIPNPPTLPLATTGNAKPNGFASEYVTPLMVTGLAVFTDCVPGFGRVSKF